MGRSFRLLRSLGSGSFGEVHLAEVRSEDDFVQTLAVKWLHARHSDDPELARRLRDEARLLGLLRHPNVVGVQGLTRIDGRLAVMMEPIVGRDLSGLSLPPRAAAEVVASVADALDAAWGTIPPGRTEPLRVVHRDLKPGNVMVTPRGHVKVMDFGVARATFEAREAETRSQQYGTARYMAPERWLEGVAEAPSDVFSLGVTLIELAGGEPVGRPRLSREGFDADLAEALSRLDAWPGLRALAAEMVRFDPGARPTAADVRERATALDMPGPDLRAWAATLPAPAPATDALTGTLVVEDTVGETFDATAEPTAPVAPAPPPRGSRWGLGMAVAAAFALGGAGWAVARLGPAGPAVDPSIDDTPPLTALEPLADPRGPQRTEAKVEPEPEPAPVAPRPRPERVETRPAAASEPTPTPEPRRVALTFVLDPGLSASTPFGALDRPRQALLVPPDSLLRLEVAHPDAPFGCTIPVGGSPATWHVSRARRCTPEG